MDPLGSIKEVLIVVILILMNGLLSMLEMALVSSRKSRLEQLADEGNAKASYVLQLAEEPTEFLSTVQIGITLVGIGTGVYSGAMLAAPLEALLREISALRPYAGVVSYTFVVALVTYLSLVLGELIPKKLALNNPEKVIMSFASFIKVIITAFKPITIFLSVSTKFFLKVLGLKPSDEPPVTEEEVRVLLEQGRLHGVFNVDEQKMIENVFELDDLRVSEIMTPRTKITWLDANDPLHVHLETIAEKQYSCYVVAEEDLEHVLGVVYTKSFLANVLAATGSSLKSSVQQPLYVPEAMHTQKLLDMFKDTRIKVALVMDEFGGLAGMVTLRDIIEHLVGDLPSYDEDIKQEIVQREDGSWLVDGLLPISEFKDFLDLDELPLEEKNGFNTVAGFVVTNIGHIPTAGNYFEWNGFRFEVVDMDGTRIDKILVAKRPAEESEKAE
ncbi:hemolysin family protein [uncultured Phascolarctobacterium sp.]|uniref:hemolysin family protein n=1 Tax=uncultured Phascolarctobacterium sp. TaxID=512296 RepID=UPI0025D2A87E|nr:hemolysin family protein [uncultured Phascolarctobacterium sp.]